jgi:hypothetical protein
MTRSLAFTTVFLWLLMVIPAEGGDASLPIPPHEFFAKLSKTTIPPGKGCCSDLRRILCDSITVSPRRAAELFRQGKLLMGDTRLRSSYDKSHIFGAIALPYNEVDFMKLKPSNVPIGLY